MRMDILKKTLKVVVSISVLIGIWQLAVLSGRYEPSLLPSPAKVLEGMAELIKDGTLFTHFRVSLTRFFIGYLAAIAAGIILGLLLGWNKSVWSFIEPVVQVLRPVSPIAWFPFIVLWFGIGDTPAVVIIFIAGFFPILLSTVSGVGNVDAIYLKVADNFGIRQPQMLFKIILPAAFPLIANGLHLALGSAGYSWWLENGRCPVRFGISYYRCKKFFEIGFGFGRNNIYWCLGLLLDRLIKLLETGIEKQWGISRRGRN